MKLNKINNLHNRLPNQKVVGSSPTGDTFLEEGRGIK